MKKCVILQCYIQRSVAHNKREVSLIFVYDTKVYRSSYPEPFFRSVSDEGLWAQTTSFMRLIGYSGNQSLWSFSSMLKNNTKAVANLLIVKCLCKQTIAILFTIAKLTVYFP